LSLWLQICSGQDSVTMADKNHSPDITDSTLSSLFWKAYSEARFDEAMEYGENYSAMASKDNDESKTFVALTNMFALYRQTGNYEKSFAYARQLYDIALNRNNRQWIASSLWGLGELYKWIEDYPAAYNYYKSAREMSNDGQNGLHIYPDSEIRFKMQYAEICGLTNHFDSALFYYHLYKPSAGAYQRYYLISMGEYYSLQGNFQLALGNFRQGLMEHQLYNDVNEEMRTLLDMGKTYLILDDYKNAMLFGREGLDIALKAGVNQYARDGYKILSDAYNRQGLADSSNYYFRKYSVVKDAVLNNQEKGRFAAYHYEQRISLMNKEKEIQAVQLQKQTLLKNILVGSIIVLVLFAFLFTRNIILQRRSEHRRRELAENELRIQKLESEKSRAELLYQQNELEMRALRAQMNPHFIFNCLNSINRFIIGNDAEQAADYLTKFAKLIRIVLEKSGLSFIPLTEELESLKLYMDLEALRFRNPFIYEINSDGLDMESVSVPSLLIQPFVENAIWHGLSTMQDRTGKITISLRLDNETLLCEIVDNGVGMSGSAGLKNKNGQYKKSLGIELTKNRLRLADHMHAEDLEIQFGELKDAEGNNAGTAVKMKIPVKINN
jgi:tetratricopeptide (TPR) repeat protein/anti-sigma regulatory factor (Ser/Thr protein kinase)